MLRRPHVAPFVRVEQGVARVAFLADPEGRIVPFLDRLCRLVRRLEGWPRRAVVEALRRQERRVRDAGRLAGIAKTLLDLCEFRAPEDAGRAAEVRAALFAARARRWPPVPGDREAPYEDAARALGTTPAAVARLLSADAPEARTLARAPRLDGRALLARYNLELARGALLDAERVRLTARGGWRGIFRAVKLARLIYRVERAGRSYRVELTGPAAPFVVRSTRYGARFARVVPALSRAPEWRLEADLVRGAERARLVLRGRPRPRRAEAPVGAHPRRTRYDSSLEASLADALRRRLRALAKRKPEAGAWRVTRETTPVAVGDELFLPDFTLRHADGREALVEVVGFWTPEYLHEKVRKVEAARLEHLVLVVSRRLALGTKAARALEAAVGGATVVWFDKVPRAEAVLRAVERVARPAA